MAININTLYVAVEQVVQKELSSGYLSPEQFNVFVNIASREKFTQDFRIFQDTQKVTDDLRSLITKAPLSTDENGVLTFPDDYEYFISLRAYDITGVKLTTTTDFSLLPQVSVKPLDSDKIGWRLSSNLFYPTVSNPIAEFVDSGIQVYPKTVTAVILEYLKLPTVGVWGFTTGTNGLEVYDATTSTDLDWNMGAFNELMLKICQYFGVSVREKELVEATAGLEQKGG